MKLSLLRSSKAAGLRTLAEEDVRRGHRANAAIGLVGFPYCAKTTLARSITAAGPDQRCHLAAEASILSRDYRRKLDLNGCQLAAHDTDALAGWVSVLLRGESVDVPRYDWLLGQHRGSTLCEMPNNGGLLVVDGSAAIDPVVARRLDAIWFFKPADYGDWFGRAVERDVAQRGWTRKAAMQENERKSATALHQLRNHWDVISRLITVV